METLPERLDRTGRLLHGTMETFTLEEIVRWVRSEPAYVERGHNALTLVKNEELRIVLVCLQAKGQMHEHHAPGSFTLNLLEGHISFTLYLGEEIDTTELYPGQFLVLEEPRQHKIVTLEESAFLLTIVTKSK